MTLNGVMALTLRYFNEFGKPAFQRITASARKKERSCSLSHLLMSFLFDFANSLLKHMRCYGAHVQKSW